MSHENGQETDEERQEKAFYQRGQAVANDARHRVAQPEGNQKYNYKASDVLAAMFFMHRQTIAQIGRRVGRLEEVTPETVGLVLENVRNDKGPSKNSDE